MSELKEQPSHNMSHIKSTASCRYGTVTTVYLVVVDSFNKQFRYLVENTPNERLMIILGPSHQGWKHVRSENRIDAFWNTLSSIMMDFISHQGQSLEEQAQVTGIHGWLSCVWGQWTHLIHNQSKPETSYEAAACRLACDACGL